jgi:hypothetical protein
LTYVEEEEAEDALVGEDVEHVTRVRVNDRQPVTRGPKFLQLTGGNYMYALYRKAGKIPVDYWGGGADHTVCTVCTYCTAQWIKFLHLSGGGRGYTVYTLYTASQNLLAYSRNSMYTLYSGSNSCSGTGGTTCAFFTVSKNLVA